MNNPIEMTVLFRDAWKEMTGRMPAATLAEEGGLVTCFANIPMFFLNMSIYDQPIAKPDDLGPILTRARQRAEHSEHGWFHALCTDLIPPGWETIAEQHGFANAMQLTGMSADSLTPLTRALPELEFLPLTDPKAYVDIARLNVGAYHMPPELSECLENDYLWRKPSYGAVAYLDGAPVSTAAAFPVNGRIYLALVATAEAHRGKGLAEACMRHVIDCAQEAMGPVPLTLHATAAGLKLYAQMGFVPQATFSVLIPS